MSYSLNPELIKSFYTYIGRRQTIWYKRFIKKDSPPWSDNNIFQTLKFCNVFRELDASTINVWSHVLDNDLSDEEILFSTIMFRMFNSRNFFPEVTTPIHPNEFDKERFINELESYNNRFKKIFNPAYILTQMPFNLEEKRGKHAQFASVLEFISEPKRFSYLLSSLKTAQSNEIIARLVTIPLVGPFLAYQIALDLTYCNFFNGINEDDILVVGPGCESGIEIMVGQSVTADECEEICWKLREHQLEYLPSNWLEISDLRSISESIPPLVKPNFLSVSAIEFNLCEWRKFYKLSNGKGRKRYFRKEKGALYAEVNYSRRP